MGGIFSKYEFSSKLDSTDKERRYEILFVALNCWGTWLVGHFTTQDHEDGSSSMFKVPPQITPVDVTTKLLAEEDRTNCYFNELIIVIIAKIEKNVETDVQYWFLLLPTKDVDYFIRKVEKATQGEPSKLVDNVPSWYWAVLLCPIWNHRGTTLTTSLLAFMLSSCTSVSCTHRVVPSENYLLLHELPCLSLPFKIFLIMASTSLFQIIDTCSRRLHPTHPPDHLVY